MLPQRFHCGICTTDVFISYTSGILCFLQWLSIEIITKLSGDISHILNNYLEYSKSIKLGDFVKAFVVPDDCYVGSLAITEINVILLEPHSP